MRTIGARITEPDPGYLLQATDLVTGILTTFVVLLFGAGTRSEVRISTGPKNRGRLEEFTAKLMLKKVYNQEMELFAQLSEEFALA